jgi:serine/threonine-protein kinase HipA
MTSDPFFPRRHVGPREAYVWIWLPGATDPVVAGVLVRDLIDEDRLLFTYAQSYLQNPESISLYTPELPLRRGTQTSIVNKIHGCIQDSGPDSWGKRVVMRRLLDARTRDESDLSPLTYFLESASNRPGALDFQTSPDTFVPRGGHHPSLADLEEVADRIDRGESIPEELRTVLLDGTSAGGARPKAVLLHEHTEFIAKFSSTTDTMPVVKAEFVAMTLARLSGIEVAPVRLTRANGRDVLLVERFDRPAGGSRRAVVSAATILRAARPTALASYPGLVDAMQIGFLDPRRAAAEVFARITFNILCGNDDDHARNHAAFWDGSMLELTPAYDVCPQELAGGEVRQSMAIGRDGYRAAVVQGCIERAAEYLLTPKNASEIVDHQIDVIRTNWRDVCDLAELSATERARLRGRNFLRHDAVGRDGW